MFIEGLYRIVVRVVKNNIFWVALIGFFALVTLFSSPLSKGDAWTDTNAMLEVGRAWKHGYLPYRDVFEQRGPVLFLYYFVANLISSRGYIGIFIIEFLNLIGIWLVGYNLLDKIPNRLFAKGFATLLPIALLVSKAIEYGGAPEEFAIFWTLLGILLAYRFLDDSSEIANWKLGLVFGLSIAVIFWIKYTLLGALIGTTLVIIVVGVIKKFKQLILFGASALVAFLGSSALIVLAFQLFSGAKDLIAIYFGVNLSAYGKPVTFAKRLAFLSDANMSLWSDYAVLLVMGLIALLALVFKRKFNRLSAMLVVSVITAYLITYGVGRFNAYSFLLIAAMIVMLMLQGFGETLNNRKFAFAVSVVAITLTAWANPFIGHVPYIWNNDTLGTQVLASYIDKTPGKQSLIYYNSLDAGVERYTDVAVAGHFKYFEHTNVDDSKFPAQTRYVQRVIDNKRADYVVVGLNWGGMTPINVENTREVMGRIPPQLLTNYKFVKASESYAPIDTIGNYTQLALLKKR